MGINGIDPMDAKVIGRCPLSLSETLTVPSPQQGTSHEYIYRQVQNVYAYTYIYILIIRLISLWFLFQCVPKHTRLGN